MWTVENRTRYNRDHLRYPSDLTDEEWALIEPLIPPGKSGGGKRTVNLREVVNGLIQDGMPCSPRTIFTLIPFGTGSDLQKTLKVPRSVQEALWVAATGITLPSDVGWVEFERDGVRTEEAFINVAGFGANGEVARRSNQSNKRLGGMVTFVGATLRTLASYKPQPVRITAKTAEGVQIWEDELLSAFVANGHYCGSGMWVGADGDMSDGQFETTLLRPTSPLQTARDFPKLYNGDLAISMGVTRLVCAEISAEPTEPSPVTIELDGESCGQLPATFRILPRVLPVRAAW